MVGCVPRGLGPQGGKGARVRYRSPWRGAPRWGDTGGPAAWGAGAGTRLHRPADLWGIRGSSGDAGRAVGLQRAGSMLPWHVKGPGTTYDCLGINKITCKG